MKTTTPIIRQHEKMWDIPKLRKECIAALVVWHVLYDLGLESRSNTVTVTRDLLMEETRYKTARTISKALTALDKAGWIERSRIHWGLEITLIWQTPVEVIHEI